MRICYFADGRTIHTFRWISYFAGLGHEMHLISFAPLSDEDVSKLHRIGVTTHGCVGNFHLKRFWLTLRDLRFIRSVLKRERIDILHSHFLATNAWFGAVSGFHPHIITAMGGDITGEDWEPSENLQEKLLTPYALRNADVVTVWGTALRRRLMPYVRNGTKIEITHGGVDLSIFKPGPSATELREHLKLPEGSRVLFSPRLARPLYNIDTIAHAAGIICETRPEVFVLVALPSHIQDLQYVSEVKAIFGNNAAKENVRYLPTLEYAEMADYFRLSDVSVSIPDTDGLGLSILESMACVTPTVIGNLPDYDREYFEHEKTTLMVDVKDPRAVADAILRYLTDSDFTTRIQTEAHRRVFETGGEEIQMKKMNDIYNELIRR